MTPHPDIRAALVELDARLRECMKNSAISAADAYDSFYQELVAEALSASPEEARAVATDLDALWESLPIGSLLLTKQALAMKFARMALAAARPRKPLMHCQNCGLTRITGSGPCDECGAEDFRTFNKLTNRITGEPLAEPGSASAERPISDERDAK